MKENTMDNRKYRIGIDLGGTYIKAGILDGGYNIQAKGQWQTKSSQGADAVILRMARAISELISKNGYLPKDCTGIGVGCPGTVNEKEGIVEYSNNIGWSRVRLAELLGRNLEPGFDSAPGITVRNDADCAALGEWIKGASKGFKNSVMLTIGTGIGSGIIIDNKLYQGASFGGGEIGHSLLIYNGEICTCGRRGCAEAYLSAPALVRQANRSKEGQWQDAKSIFDAAKKEDPAAGRILSEYLDMLGELLTDVANTFRPEIILLGGGVSAAGEILLPPLREKLQKYAFGNGYIPVPRVELAALRNDAGIIGAAVV